MQSQELTMYGKTHIDYGNIKLEAEETKVNWYKRTITSTYEKDTTGRKIGRPVFTEAEDVYETDNIIYNFNTKRAIIKGVVTEQDGAYMHGDDVKKNEEDELFIRGARYTTCNLSDPHFFIESQKLKVIPGNKVISGPFNLRFRELLTPLWFPFGMFPQPKKRASGIVFPTYGEETRRGFFLRGGGYYFALNDYMDLRLVGDVYSKGGSGLSATTNYFVRYKFRGTFNFNYTRNVFDNSQDIGNPIKQNDFWVTWNHRPQSTGTSSFSASVSAGTSTFNNNNNVVNQDFERSINPRFTSNVSYSKRFQTIPFNMSLNGRHNQNISTGIMTISLPEFTLNMNRIYPLKSFVSSQSPLAKLNFSHNFVAKNEITNQPTRGSFNQFEVVNGPTEEQADEVLEFNQENLPTLFERAKTGGRHQIPVNTSISLLKNISLNPSFNYEEFWYLKELDFTYLEEENAVRVDTIDGFSRAGSWRSSASLNTIVYGTYFFPGDKKLQAIRHVMTPSLSFSYNPDFSSPKYGVYKDVQADSTGRTVRVSKYEGFIFGSPTGRESRTLGFNLNNNVEIKVKDPTDTTGTGTKKIKIIDNLSFSSGYNFAADSFNLSSINFRTRTAFFNNALNVNFSGTIDPYTYVLLSGPDENGEIEQARIDRFAWNSGNGVGQIERFSTNISLRLRPKKSKNDEDEEENETQNQDLRQNLGGLANPDDPMNYDSQFGTPEELAYINNNPAEYVDFNIPWTLNVQYNITRTKTGFEEPRIIQTLSFSGDISLTPKTKIQANSGYDLDKKQFTQTRLSINRDLHCWALSFSWVPFGRFQSFNLTIRPKSSLLQDLKLERRRSFQDFFN